MDDDYYSANVQKSIAIAYKQFVFIHLFYVFTSGPDTQ